MKYLKLLVASALCGLLCSCSLFSPGLTEADLDLQQLIETTTDSSIVPVPRGTYVLDDSLKIVHDNVILRCEPGTIIHVRDVNKPVILIKGAENVAIENASLSHLKPLEEYDCHGSVIDIEDSRDVRILNCELNGCGAIGIRATAVTRMLIKYCWIHHNSFNALYFLKCEEVKLLSNIIEDNRNFMQVYHTDGFEASDNIIRNNGGYWRIKESSPGLR